jgi:predicted transposase YbfD/YdcC
LKLQNFQNKKSSEIGQVQELVRGYPLSGKVFTLDALHCQKETTTLITQSKNDYIIALKGNQKTLLKHAVKIAENETPKSQSQSVDISHGRNIVIPFLQKYATIV